VQDLGGQVARSLGYGRVEAGLESGGCVGDGDHGHGDLLCSDAGNLSFWLPLRNVMISDINDNGKK
jgi:hypothetical protein